VGKETRPEKKKKEGGRRNQRPKGLKQGWKINGKWRGLTRRQQRTSEAGPPLEKNVRAKLGAETSEGSHNKKNLRKGEKWGRIQAGRTPESWGAGGKIKKRGEKMRNGAKQKMPTKYTTTQAELRDERESP